MSTPRIARRGTAGRAPEADARRSPSLGPAPPGRAPAPGPLAPWLDRLLCLVPVGFLATVLGGIAVSVVALVGTAHPDAQYGATVNSDAAALLLGQPLYQDPTVGYSGNFYTPLFPAMVSVLDRLALWTGWPLLITLLATLGPLAITAWLAFRRPGERRGDVALAVVEAVGVGAMAWALASTVQLNGIWGANGLHDQVAWVPGLLGLALVPAAASGSRRALVIAVIALSAAFWAKQNTVAAGVAAGVWMLMAAGLGAVGWRRALGFTAALAGLNALILGGLNLLTSGWAWALNVVVPSRHPLGDLGDAGFPANLPRFLREDFIPATALGLLFAGAIWLTVALSRRAEARPEGEGARSPGARPRLRALLRPGTLTVPVLVTITGALLYRRAGDLNLYFLTAPSERGARFVASVVAPLSVLAVVFLITLALSVVVRRTGVEHIRRGSRSLGSWLTTAPARDRVASVLVLSVIVGLPLAFYFRQKVGGDDNYYIGMAWAIAMLGAIGYRHARARARGAPIAAVVVAGIFVLMLAVSPTRQTDAQANAVNLPSLARVTEGANPEHSEWLTVFFPAQGLLPARTQWSTVSTDLLDYAADHPVYHKDFGDLNVASEGRVWPQYQIFAGSLAGGVQPRYLVEAWLDRRFDAVTYPFEAGGNNELFTSGGGRWEENYLWKLNEVLRARYRPSPAVPSSMYERRPGPEPARWMRECFGPFGLAGTSWRINRGGGFWCRPGGGARLALRSTPAPYSDVRTEAPVRSLTGALLATARPGGGFFEVTVEPSGGQPLRLRGEPGARGRMTLTTFRGPTATGRLALRAPGGRVTLDLEPAGSGGPLVVTAGAGSGRARVAVPSLGEGAVVRLAGTRASGATFDLGRLRAR